MDQIVRNSLRRPGQIGLLLVLVSVIAVATSWRGRPPAGVISISGLDLQVHREDILKKIGQPSFQDNQISPALVEYWTDPDHPTLSLRFHPDGSLLRLEGGRPEINGEPVGAWSLDQVERALGPASGSARGNSLFSEGAVGSGDAYLRYPERHLLVTWNSERGTSFILFSSSRRKADHW